MFTKFIIFWHNLSFKKTLGIVFLLSLFLAVPLTALIIQREQSIFSLADNQENEQKDIDESLIPYPTNPPSITHIEKFYGRPGDSILIYGANFGQAQKESVILLNNQPLGRDLTNYWSDSEIEFSLPARAGIYSVGLSINGNSSFWWGNINVFDDLTTARLSFSPDNNVINVPSPEYDISVYSMTGNVNILGTSQYKTYQASAPIDLVGKNIVYVEVKQNGVLVPFRVLQE